MKRLGLLGLAILLAGCGAKNRAGEGDREAVIKGKGTMQWIAELKSDDEVTRRNAKRTLRDTGKKDETVRFDLLETVKGNNGDDKAMRIGAADVLGEIGWDADDCFGHLKAMISKEPDEEVTRAVARAMTRIDPKEAAKLGIPSGEVEPAPKKR